MAIRKDIDDMLNSLKNSGEAPKTESAKAAAAHPKQRKSIYDDMSVDDLLNALTDTKQPEPVEVPEEEEVPVIVSSVMHTEASTQSTRVFSAAEIAEMEAKAAEKAEPAAEEKPVPKKKKKIVISAELPDYEEIRRRDLEKDRLEREAADRAARETEEKARLEAERVAREAEEKARLEAERSAREAEEKARLEAENTAHEVTAEEGSDEVHGEETDDKSGIFSKIKNIFSSDKEEPEADGETDTEENPVSELAEELFGNMNNGLETADESEPPTDLTETESEIATPPILDETAEDDDSTDSVDSLLDNIRENTAAAIADLEAPAVEKEETPETPAEVPEEPAKKRKSRVTSALEGILDENPDEIISERSEKTEDDVKTPKKRHFKKKLYTVLGVVFSIFAVIGIVATVTKCSGLLKSFTSGEVKKDSFTQMIYPAVIMDIESFNSPEELTSEQVITATLWSIIMDDSKSSKYESSLGDTVSIPDVDVEKYAVELFGEDLPTFEHCTVGPVESRFYYSDGAYNVRLRPIIFTYSPEIKSIVKSGSNYTLTVDYIDELPSWMEKSVAKTVEFGLTQNDDGTFCIKSMKILSVKSSNAL
ncbi:MAG: hypothetical protein MR022_08895 [Ruminococcus sp.]|nr:hypothetical protein [Ruminococcus sp.]